MTVLFQCGLVQIQSLRRAVDYLLCNLAAHDHVPGHPVHGRIDVPPRQLPPVYCVPVVVVCPQKLPRLFHLTRARARRRHDFQSPTHPSMSVYRTPSHVQTRASDGVLHKIDPHLCVEYTGGLTTSPRLDKGHTQLQHPRQDATHSLVFHGIVYTKTRPSSPGTPTRSSTVRGPLLPGTV